MKGIPPDDEEAANPLTAVKHQVRVQSMEEEVVLLQLEHLATALESATEAILWRQSQQSRGLVSSSSDDSNFSACTF